MSNTLHSDLGASGMYRWSNCAGSFRLIQGLGTKLSRRRSVHAARGTLAHRLIENILMDAMQHHDLRTGVTMPDDLLGRVYQQDGHDIEVDQDFFDAVKLMVDYVSVTAVRHALINIEAKVSLDGFLKQAKVKPPVPLFATTDVRLLDPAGHLLEIVDYKHGAGVFVKVEDNPQLMYYAAGTLAEIAEQNLGEVHEVKITVVQPNAVGHQKIRTQTLDAIDVLMWVDDTLIPAVQACADPNAPFNPGSWCRWCPAAQACPALAEDANAMAKRDFAEHMLPRTPAELAAALDTAERAERWIDAVRSYALEQAKAQVHIPGWGLEPTRATRRWTSEEMVTRTLIGAGLSPEMICKQELLSPAQMNKQLFGRKIPAPWWNTHIEPLIERHSSGVKLTRTQNDPVDQFVLADEEH